MQITAMWANVCTKEDMVAGVRLYPLLDTPVHAFAPSGVDKQRCVALGEDTYTVSRDSVLRKLPIVFVGEGSDFTPEPEALQILRTSSAALICTLRLLETGGAMPLQ
jgi:hypothetical protein